jgi:tRNA pseudouridine38-40 synthase
MRLRLDVEYDGSAFHGWQLQPDVLTVQGALEAAIAEITGQVVRVHGSGRTDRGVHASGQVAHFDLPGQHWDSSKLKRGIAAVTPRQLAVLDVRAVHADFHARYHAVARRYRYRFSNQAQALQRHRVWFLPQRLALAKMREVCELLPGQTDFRAFCKAGSDVSSFECKIFKATILVESASIMAFEIVANRFLYGMVRALMGLLVAYAEGRLSSEMMREIFTTGERHKVPMAAPAHGLTLEQVAYKYEEIE